MQLYTGLTLLGLRGEHAVQLTSVRAVLDVMGVLRDVDYVLRVKTADAHISASGLL